MLSLSSKRLDLAIIKFMVLKAIEYIPAYHYFFDIQETILKPFALRIPKVKKSNLRYKNQVRG